MKQNHVEAVAETHLHSFEGFFLSFLGWRFLKLLYKGILTSPLGASYVYMEDSKVVGFICGVVDPSRFFKELLWKNWWRFALASLDALKRKPSIARRLTRAILYPGANLKGSSNATILSVAISPKYQGRNIGTQLVEAFSSEMRERSVSCVRLTTDKNDNESANAFYQKLGFQIKRAYVTPEGREMNDYVMML